MNLFKTVKHIKETTDKSWEQIVADIKPLRDFKSGEALRSWYKRERSRIKDQPREDTYTQPNPVVAKVFKDTTVPTALPKPFEEILSLKLNSSESVLVIADVHVPYHHEEFIRAAVNMQEYAAIIVAGDLFVFDQISKYSKAHNIPRMETELEIGGSMLMYLASHAPVYITNSNHDARFANRIDAQFSLKRLMNAALNGRKPKNSIITTERDYMFVNDDYIIGHLNNASGVAGKIAHNIAQKYQRHCLAGHDHIAGVFNPRSRYIGASIGCSADYTKFWYSEKGMNPVKFMQRGFAVVDGDSTVKLYNEQHKLYYQRDLIGENYRSILIDKS